MGKSKYDIGFTSWERSPLGRFGIVVGGGTPSRSRGAYWNGSIPWASVKDFDDDSVFLEDTIEHISEAGLINSAANLMPANTPVVCTRMAVGRCALTSRPTAINQDLKAFLLARDVDVHFFIRMLRFYGPILDRISIGSTVRGVTLSDLLSLEVYHPSSTGDQARIAYVLDKVDEAIQKTEAVIAKLKQIRAGMLHDLLTYGLDKDGKLRDPIAYPEQFKDSELGRIPKEWEVGPFSDIAYVNPPTHATGLIPFSPVSFIPMQDVDEGGNWVYWQAKSLVSCGNGYTPFIEGDVLFAKITPCMENGKGCHAINLVNGFGMGSTEFHVLRPKSKASARFVFHCSLTNLIRIRALAYMTGSAGQQRVEACFFDRYLMPIPPAHERISIANTIDETDSHIEASRQEMQKLQTLKFGLMDDLLRGKVPVPADLLPEEVTA